MLPAATLVLIAALPVLEPGESAWLRILMLALATLVSEDLTCIAAGILVHDGRLALPVALAGCFLGIFVSDTGLWMLGRLCGQWLMRRRWFRKRISPELLNQVSRWFQRRAWAAVLAARFLPGTRVPVYIAAGMLGARARAFILWALIAGLLWTPFLVGLAAAVGSVILRPLQARLGSTWVAVLFGAVLMYIAIRAVELLATEIGRARLGARIARIRHWEFWPQWVLQLPLLPALGWLAVRHRGLTIATAANPGLRSNGAKDVSKSAILSRLPRDTVAACERLAPGSVDERFARLSDAVERGEWLLPFVLKPDCGRHGAGFKLVRALDDALRVYLPEQTGELVLQRYHPGPHEAAIVYYRLPDAPGAAAARGRILSLAYKQFPVLIGDGRSTVERLIWRHPRYRLQARLFLKRLRSQAGHVLAIGEPMPLAMAGNHSQGTMLRDGSHLITPQLEQAIDRIAQSLPGFHFGCLDVRYADPEELKNGRGFQVVALGTRVSESARIAEPGWSVMHAWRALHAQWRLRFEIGARNRALGHTPLPLSQVVAGLTRRAPNRSSALVAD